MKQANNYVSKSTVAKLKAHPFSQDAIIFAKVGAAILHERKRIAQSPFLIDNNMMAFTPKEHEDIDFIYHLFQKLKLSKYVQVGALPSYNASDILDIRTFYPASCIERSKIVAFLNLLSMRIEKQTEILSCLKKYKRGVTQQVFSERKEDGAFPKWKAACFGKFFTEQTIRTSNSLDTPLVSLTVEDGITPKTERYYREFLVTKEGDNYKVIKPGWFAYNPMNAHLGAIAPNHLGYTAVVSGYYNIFSVNDAETICFWEEYLTSYPMLIHYKLIATGSLIEKQRVHYSQFVNIRRSLPSVEEQKHLSKMFMTLNTKIANAESIEQKLVRMRNSLLQQLFI